MAARFASIVFDAFGNCHGLTSVTIGTNVISIGGWEFERC